MIEEAHGNLLAADVEALVNTVNTVGVMGKGIALQFKRAFPDNYSEYERACKRDEVELGKMFVHETGAMNNPKFIVNFPTKKHWKSSSKLRDVASGLTALRDVIRELNIRSIAIPPLGCGNGGLDWREVYPLIREILKDLQDVRILIYPPEGAPAAADMPVRTKRPQMTRTRAALLLAFERYIQRSVSTGLSDTREMSIVEAQKAAYFLQVAGWGIKFDFVPSHFGPFAQTVNQFISHSEGHFIYGFGDGSSGSKATLTLDERAVAEAHELLGDDEKFRDVLNRFSQIVDGFEFPYGVELLSTVHFVVEGRATPPTIEEVVAEIQSWSTRKGRIFKHEQASLAYEHLVSAKVVEPVSAG
ncbi:macro domain-containing protein [Lentzea albidocapillata]|uniref:O-acetyl-ADP-ribose deacetylase (Regulator of RNase III), contains Macro domain n=1 Tax=Lentzea albidocapillata TaxID=40571 RepID=A0A1W2E9Z5_9PSEU|nr:macro domain-containing protein [Lentzea albidocapillata]SMD06561.1 O-acetyl-ADP-ribose deacetylase (regulator of RNase III), contains Macro domain [Lentzea albidocapillata]